MSGDLRFFYVGGFDVESELRNIDAMAVSVMRQYHWTPETIDNLDLNDSGYNGLEFQYEAIQGYIKEIKSKKVG